MSSAWGVLIGAGLIAGTSVGIVAAPLLVVVLVVLQVVRGRLRALPLAVIAGAALIGAFRNPGSMPADVPLDLATSTGGTGTVVGLPAPSERGDRVLLRVESIVATERIITTDFAAMAWLPDNVVAAPGDRLTVLWDAKELQNLPPGFARYVTSRGGRAVVYVHEVARVERSSSWLRPLVLLRRHLSERFQNLLPGNAGALAAGIVSGDDTALSDRVERAFLATGTSHVTAVSGSNVSMLLAVWNVVVPPGRLRRRMLVQAGIIGTIWLYAVFVGLEPPAVRAALVASFGVLAVRSGRRADPMTLLLVASATLVMWRPATTGMLSFWLSLAASAAIVGRLPAESGTSWKRGARAIGSAVLCTYPATLPIVLTAFGTVSLSAVVANAILAPLMVVAFPLAFAYALVALMAPTLAPVVTWLPETVLTLAVLTVERLAAVGSPLELGTAGPLAAVPLATASAAASLAFSRDGQRWWRLAEVRMGASMADRIVPVLALAGLAGFAAGVIAALMP